MSRVSINRYENWNFREKIQQNSNGREKNDDQHPFIDTGSTTQNSENSLSFDWM